MADSTRFIVLPDGTCAPLEGCMIIDVPDGLSADDYDGAEEWIAENADCGYCFHTETIQFEMESYYDLINRLLTTMTDEQLLQTPTIQNTPGDEYGPLCIVVTDESCDVLDPNHIVLTQTNGGV
jgi:hypothetical protein